MVEVVLLFAFGYGILNAVTTLMTKKLIISTVATYVVSTLAAFAFFRVTTPKFPVSLPADQVADGESPLSKLLQVDPGEPKDQPCPLNGQLYTSTERTAWEKRRPLAVMIENTPDSRPQSGLSHADVVYEAIAEGGVTRFMALYLCGVQQYDTTLAPIRSARSYFIDWASGYNRPLYVHVGGANLPGPADALGQLSEYGWNGENDLNQFSIGYPTFIRNYNRLEGKEVATEHTMETSTEKLWKVGVSREWTNLSPEMKRGRTVVPPQEWRDGFTGWQFMDKLDSAAATVSEISYEFWTGFDQYAVKWVFDPQTRVYKRFLAGEQHVDLNNDQQIMASTVVVLLTDETGPIDEKKHMLYRTTGTGDALLYMNGQKVKATWSKKDRVSELTFAVNGKEVELAPGLIWISVVDKSTPVQES